MAEPKKKEDKKMEAEESQEGEEEVSDEEYQRRSKLLASLAYIFWGKEEDEKSR